MLGEEHPMPMSPKSPTVCEKVFNKHSMYLRSNFSVSCSKHESSN